MTMPTVSPLEFLIGGVIPAIPQLVIWTAALVIAIIMMRRGGGRAERFLIAGASLFLLSGLLYIPTFLVIRLSNPGIAAGDTSFLSVGLKWLREAISMAGTVCLIYAFWVRFKIRMALRTEPDIKSNDGETIEG